MHLKNFSILHLENIIALSPAYDLLNVNLVFPKDQEEMALLLNGKKKNIKLRDFEALGVVLNIPDKVRDNIYKKFQSCNTEIYTLINNSFLSSEKKEIYWEIWNNKQSIFE
jgi:serine/threonine-protein kinase HipA